MDEKQANNAFPTPHTASESETQPPNRVDEENPATGREMNHLENHDEIVRRFKKTKPTAGDYIIVNHVDRPESRLIAHVDRVNDDGSLVAHYVNIDFKTMDGINPDDATRVQDFGCKIEVIDGRLRAFQTGEPSVAKYRDGSPRKWQE